MQKKNMTGIRILKQAGIYICLIVVWQLLYVLGTSVFQWWKPYAMPNPREVFKRFLELTADKTLVYAVYYSLIRAVSGFFAAFIIGFAVGGLMTFYDLLNKSLKPLILGIQSLPSVCWVPFAILWFGLKDSAILFVIVMGSAFSIAISVENGIKNVSPVYINAAKTMGAGKWDLFWKVILPASLPSLIAGLRQGWSFAWRALMSAEVMSATIGLGYTLMLGRDLADINQVMLVMIVIVIVGILIDKCVFSNIERRVLKKRGFM